MTNKITADELNYILEQTNKTVVKFSAEWCGPCKVLEENLKGSYIDYYNVDIEEQGVLLPMYNIKSVPTLIFFWQGKEVDRTVGVISKDKFIEIYENIGREG